MKTSLLAALLGLAFTANAAAQATWTKQAPLPTWKNCLSISAPGDDLFFASAGALFGQTGDVLRNDGGTHLDWSVQPLSISTVNAVYFLDGQRGWAAGNGMFHTLDGGQTWVQDNTWGSMYDLFFLDAQHGWAAGNGGIVYRTTDGGLTWTGDYAALGGTTARSVFFLDAQHGWAAAIGGHLSETTDGGVTWTTRHAGGTYLTTVQFLDAAEGWGMGGDTFVHTLDGGATWTPVALPPGSWIHGGDFHDALHGVGVGDAGNIVYTHDGGLSWQTARPQGNGPRLWCVDFSPGGVAVASGENGLLLRSDDFGATWSQLQSGASWTTGGMDAHDGLTAWSANQAGEVSLTVDGGVFWERVQVQGFDAYSTLTDVDFADAQAGWTVGQQQVFGLADLGQIARSTDGGHTWQLQYSQGGTEFLGVTAIDADSALAYGRGLLAASAYLRTDDGGQTWSPNGNPALVGTFRDAFFLPGTQLGWLVSDDVWHSTDGGQTWALQYAGGISLASVCFVDAQHGWVSGFVNTLLHTDDGGVTWTPQDPGGPAGAAYTSVSAISPLEAVVVGWDDFVARTTDGGQTWVQEFPGDLSMAPDLVEWNAAVMLAPGDGWIGGNAGIYRSGDGWQVVGTSFCAGEVGACPCANPGGAGVGCAHSAGHGARLDATGSTHGGAGTLALHASQCPPGVPGLLISGTVPVGGGAGAQFGDGLRCAGGVVTRLQVVVADALGDASSSVDVAAKDGAQAGQTRYYQLWYRDPVNSPCGSAFNLTNGLAVTWDS